MGLLATRPVDRTKSWTTTTQQKKKGKKKKKKNREGKKGWAGGSCCSSCLVTRKYTHTHTHTPGRPEAKLIDTPINIFVCVCVSVRFQGWTTASSRANRLLCLFHRFPIQSFFFVPLVFFFLLFPTWGGFDERYVSNTLEKCSRLCGSTLLILTHPILHCVLLSSSISRTRLG